MSKQLEKIESIEGAFDLTKAKLVAYRAMAAIIRAVGQAVELGDIAPSDDIAIAYRKLEDAESIYVDCQSLLCDALNDKEKLKAEVERLKGKIAVMRQTP